MSNIISKKTNRSSKRVLVGMSGGVDSCVAAALLVEQGFEVIGITIKTYKYEDVGGNVGNDSSCCSLDGINDARRVASGLGIPHYVVDWTEVFRKKIIDYFIEEYVAGNTPNPCVICNREIKWNEMLSKADALGAEYIATGHYAKTNFSDESNRWYISRGVDKKKDQSYALWNLTQESIARTIFPLHQLTKDESRAHAQRLGLGHLISKKKESYELCFIPDDDYHGFLKRNSPGLESKTEGGAITLDGKKIGEHKGYPFYTIGQRKGLGVSHPEPLFVLDILSETNEIKVGLETDLSHDGLEAQSVNLQKYTDFDSERELTVKIRYNDSGRSGRCAVTDDNSLQIVFTEPRKAITRGQSVVMFDGDDVVGGGIITSTFDKN